MQPLSPPPRKLSIIQNLVSAYKLWHEMLPNMPKDFKRTFAVKLDELFLSTIESLYLAGYSEKESKLVILNRTVAKINRLKFLLMVAWEIRGLANKKYIALSEKIDETGKMLNGWLVNTEKKNSRE